MKKLIVNILVGVVFLTIAGTAKATEPEVTFTQEMADAIMVDVVAKMDSLDQESFAKWLYEQGKQSETQNLAVANVFYTSYLTALRGVIIMTHVTPEIYANQSFWLSVTANIKDIQRFAIRNANRYPLLSQTLYNCELYSKGLQLRSARLLDKKLASIDDPELKRDWFLLKKIREIFELYNSFIQERQPEIDAMMRA